MSRPHDERTGAPPTAQELAERAVEWSTTDGCVVIVEEVTDANLRWANNTLTTNGFTRDRHVTVIAVDGAATGVMSQSGVDDVTAVKDLLGAAEETARSSSPAEDQAPLVTATAPASDWDEPPARTGIEVFSGFARDLGQAFRRAVSEGEVLFGYASHEMRTTYLATSAGVRVRHAQPTGYVEWNAKSTDFARSSWSGVATDDFTDVDVDGITADLHRRLGWAERRIDLPPGRYDTLLPPTAVADLMIDMYWSAGGRDAAEGRTAFSRPGGGTRVGERLTGVPVNVRSDPADPFVSCAPIVVAHASSASLSAFDNGLPLQPTAWIDGGELRALVQTRSSAQGADVAVTPYIDNLIMDGSDSGADLEAMIASTDRALLLTCLWYIREVDPRTLLLTGLTRDGVYLVEHGEVVGAVNNFRFNESPIELLGRIAEMGASQRTLPREWSDYFTRTIMPPLRVEGFNMSSVSQAS